MLTLSRPVRRIAATLMVLAGCVAPTVYVVATAWRVNQSDHVRKVEEDLGRRLGMRVRLDSVLYPRPGGVAYRGLVLSGADVGGESAELVRAGVIRLRPSNSGLAIESDGLRLRGTRGPNHILSVLAAAVQRLGDEPGWATISMLAPTCEVELGSDELGYSLTDLAWTYRVADDNAARLTASYRVAGDDGSDPRCELTLARELVRDAPQTTLILRSTDSLPLPAQVLDPFFDTRSWLGTQATMDGELTLRQLNSGSWEARFQGNLNDVDLTALARRVAPGHALNGRARVAVTSARWEDQPGRGPGWVEAVGTLTSTTPGRVSTSLLAALQSQLGFRVAGPPDPSSIHHDFQALGLAFAIDPLGEIRVGGALGNAYLPDTVLVDARGFAPFVFAPPEPATVPGLIRTLASGDAGQPELMVPAGLESLMIQRYLPAGTIDGAVRRARLGELPQR